MFDLLKWIVSLKTIQCTCMSVKEQLLQVIEFISLLGNRVAF